MLLRHNPGLIIPLLTRVASFAITVFRGTSEVDAVQSCLDDHDKRTCQ
jgi:hypothetical protein